MLYFIKFLYSFLSPPGIWIVLLLLFTWLNYKKNYRLSIFVSVITILIYVSSIPLIADGLVRSIESKYQPPTQINGDVIIMLAGGTTADTTGIAGPGHPSGERQRGELSLQRLCIKNTNCQ